MADQGGIQGPFRITQTTDTAHGGYFEIDASRTLTSATYIAGNTAVFRSSTRFLLSAKNATANAMESNGTIPYAVSTDNGTITLTYPGALAGGRGNAHYYFICFNGGTKYTID